MSIFHPCNVQDQCTSFKVQICVVHIIIVNIGSRKKFPCTWDYKILYSHLIWTSSKSHQLPLSHVFGFYVFPPHFASTIRIMWFFDTPHNNQIEGFISHICCEVEAIGQMAYSFHLCYEAKEMNKTQILMDNISTLSWNFNMP